MIESGDLRRGITIQLEGTIYQVLDWKHIKMGRGSAQVRMKLRDIVDGHTIERTFQSGERFPRAVLERQEVQYLYNEGDLYHFMNTETYDQMTIDRDKIEEALPYLVDGMSLSLIFYESDPVGVELPTTVELTIVEAPPSFRGDTAAGNTKPVVLETGITIQVPYFLEAGERVVVDTRSGEYAGRAQS